MDQLSNFSILVVEDNAFTRKLLRSMLAGFGVRHIHEAHSGTDGFSKLASLRPDLLLLDWTLPDMSAAELISMIRDPQICEQAEIPIVVITAQPTRKRVLEAARLGVHELLAKPVSPKTLYYRLASALLVPRVFIQTSEYFGPEPRHSGLSFSRNRIDIPTEVDSFETIVSPPLTPALTLMRKHAKATDR